MEITKNTDTSKYKYQGYEICFDEGGMFSMGNINNGRNVLIFGEHENSVIHSNNKANNIIMATIIMAISLHYNGDDSYLLVNGKQELKFKCKTESLVKEKLCIGNLSKKWTISESEKTGLY